MPRRKSPIKNMYTDDQSFLQKNSGPGGGNNIQSVEQYYERQKPEGTHQKKME